MVHHLPQYDLDSIATVDDALTCIEINLDELIQMVSTPVVGREAINTMNDNVRFVKRFYERAELLLMKAPV